MIKKIQEQSDVNNGQSMTSDNNLTEPTLFSIDRETARVKELSLSHPNETLRRIYKSTYEDLLWEKEWMLKESKAIIKSAVRGTKKWIQICYPALLNWNEDNRSYQLRTKRPFSIEMIEFLGKEIKTVKCVCRDGVERTFEIKKIEAFYGHRKSKKGEVKNCVNIYF